MSRIYGIPDDEVAGIEEEVEKFCELGDAYDRKYSSLSSGMAEELGWIHHQFESPNPTNG